MDFQVGTHPQANRELPSVHHDERSDQPFLYHVSTAYLNITTAYKQALLTNLDR